MESFGFFILLLDATLRVSVPLVLAALAGLFSERSGIVDIGLEGKMLGGAFAAAAASFVCSEQLAAAGLEGLLPAAAWVGLAAAVLWSVLLALLHGVACIRYHGNQIVSGVAINILMSGLTVLLGIAWFSQGGRTPQLPPGGRFRPVVWPGAEAVAEVPVLGHLYSELLSGHNVLVYLAFLAVPLTFWVVYRTRFGLRCVPSARIPRRWTPPASPWRACATAPWWCAGRCAGSRARTCLPRSRRRSSRT